MKVTTTDGAKRLTSKNSRATYSHRLVSFGGGAIRLKHTDGRAAEIVDLVFKDVLGDESIASHTSIRISEDKGGTFSLDLPGEGTRHQVPSAVVARRVLDAACDGGLGCIDTARGSNAGQPDYDHSITRSAAHA